MKISLVSLVLIMLTACSQHAVYDMLHERERQECLKQGRSDCPSAESYDKYKQKRDEVMNPKEK
jgi:hypothetical protein